MKLVIDSNIFVSSLDPSDIFHEECWPIFQKLLKYELEALCPTLVLIETICVIRRRTNNIALSIKIYQNLIKIPSINWLDITIDVAVRACMLGSLTGLKGGDTVVLQVAEQYGIPLLTKDKEIKTKSPGEILIFEPSDLSF
ncbi:MAG: type II toxin-antitoxin system VapC family toxin [Thermodesulfobacteriota bacterium]